MAKTAAEVIDVFAGLSVNESLAVQVKPVIPEIEIVVPLKDPIIGAVLLKENENVIFGCPVEPVKKPLELEVDCIAPEKLKNAM